MHFWRKCVKWNWKNNYHDRYLFLFIIFIQLKIKGAAYCFILLFNQSYLFFCLSVNNNDNNKQFAQKKSTIINHPEQQHQLNNNNNNNRKFVSLTFQKNYFISSGITGSCNRRFNQRTKIHIKTRKKTETHSHHYTNRNRVAFQTRERPFCKKNVVKFSIITSTMDNNISTQIAISI